MVVGTKTVSAVVTPGFTKWCLCIWRCPWCYQSKLPPNHVQSDHGKRNPTCEAHHTHWDAACVWCMFCHFMAYNQLYSKAAVEHISLLTLTLPLVSYPSQVIIPSSLIQIQSAHSLLNGGKRIHTPHWLSLFWFYCYVNSYITQFMHVQRKIRMSIMQYYPISSPMMVTNCT